MGRTERITRFFPTNDHELASSLKQKSGMQTTAAGDLAMTHKQRRTQQWRAHVAMLGGQRAARRIRRAAKRSREAAERRGRWAFGVEREEPHVERAIPDVSLPAEPRRGRV